MLVDNIRALCMKKGMSLTDLEHELFLANGTIGKWKNNGASLWSVQQIADYFGVPVETLTKGDARRRRRTKYKERSKGRTQ